MSSFVLIAIATWHFELIPGATEDIVLDVDTAGNASIAYFKDSVVYYAKRVAVGDSFQWLTEIVDSGAVGPQGYGNPVELAIDKSTNPHLIYFKSDLYYATKDSLGNWQSTMLDTFEHYRKSGLDTDTMDYPHVVGGELLVWHYYWDGSSWNSEYIGEISYVSLVSDKNNNLHIGIVPPIICDRQHGFTYGFRDSTGWHLEYISGFDVRWPIGIAVDTACCPHLAFYDYYGYSYHSMKQNGEWMHENITTHALSTALIAVANTVPHILGMDIRYEHVVHVWKQDSAWHDEWIFWHAYPKDIAIDSDGYAHCILADAPLVLYGTTRPQGICERVSSILGFSQPATMISGPLRLPEDKNCRVFDITGRVVAPDRIRPGIYFIEVEGKITQKVIRIK